MVLGTVYVNPGIKTYVSGCSHLLVQRSGNDTPSRDEELVRLRDIFAGNRISIKHRK